VPPATGLTAPTGGSRADVAASLKNIGVITLFTENLDASKAFYQAVFDVPVIFEDDNSAVVRFDNLIVNLLKTTAAHDLVAPAEPADPQAGVRFQFTVGVDDVDATCAELAGQGVALLNGPMDRPWGVRTASFTDPGGHIWEIAQDLEES
jgi:catechol 2,3-dioxygenase-like lactoylglutathione lyase family enzyme